MRIRRGWWSGGWSSTGRMLRGRFARMGRGSRRCVCGLRMPRSRTELTRAGIELEPGCVADCGAHGNCGRFDIDVRRFAKGARGFRMRGRSWWGNWRHRGWECSARVGRPALQPVRRPAVHVLDACAAPGGKTLILAERNLEARIVACEASEQRLAGCENGLLDTRGGLNAGWRMRARWKMSRRSIWCWPMCLAAGRERWEGIRRFGIGCAWRIWIGMRSGSGGFCARRCGQCGLVGCCVFDLLTGAGRE